MKNILYLISFILLTLYACNDKNEPASKKKLSYEVKNNLDFNRFNSIITIELDELKNTFPEAEAFAVFEGQKEVVSQLITRGPQQGLLILIDSINGGTIKNIIIHSVATDSATVFPKRTQAEISIKNGGEWKGREYIGGHFENVESLKVPQEHTDHSGYIRYEGPGWESDLVAYRFYLDWRNATDIFGKTTHDMVLQKVGQVGFDSYHELNDWGMDVLKVGNSLGIGAPAYFERGKAIRVDSTDSLRSEVFVNGSIYSSVKTNHYGWRVAGNKLNLRSYYSIHAGSRLTHHQIVYDGDTDNIATGIVKSDSAQLYKNEGSTEAYGYIATYGRQSLNEDNLGLAVLFPADKLKQITADDYSDIVVLKPANKEVNYYFLAAWELEKNGIKNEKDFLSYVEQMAKELANPLSVSLKN